MANQNILDLHKDMVRVREEMAAGYEHVAVEIPRGRPQIEYHSKASQQRPRGGLLRCIIGDRGLEEGQTFTDQVPTEEITLGPDSFQTRFGTRNSASNSIGKQTFRTLRTKFFSYVVPNSFRDLTA
jgi:hypothetical protein